MKILITGATGFVGAYLTENLVIEDHEVIAVIRTNSNKWRLSKIISNINCLEIDLCDSFNLNTIIKQLNPEIIFHFAAYGGYPFQKETLKIIHTNLIGTVNLVDACLNIDYKAFINIGSSSEYGTKINPMKETDVLEPINAYGVAKASATLYCHMIAKTQNRSIATVRLFSPYGCYEDKSRLIPSVILSCLKGKNPELSSGAAVRDFIFIEDVIELLKTVSSSKNIGGKIYNGGSGKQHSVEEMVNAIIQQVDTKIKPAWGCLEGRVSDAAQKWEADMSLVKRELNWQPKFTLETGVKKTVEWYKKNIELYGV